MTPLRTRLCIAALLALGGLAVPAGSAWSQTAPGAPSGGGSDPFGFAVRPFTAPGAQPRDAIDYDLQAGQTVHERVSVINVTDVAKQFYVYAQTAYNAPVGGGFALNLRTDPVTDAAKWITVPISQQTVPAHTAAIIPVTINVPIDAEPGDHAAGVVAEEIVAPGSIKSGQGVVKIPRVATRVYLRVQGPLHPLLQVQRLVVTHHDPLLPGVTGSGSASVAYTVKNVGNVRIQLDRVSVVITGVFGREVNRFTAVRGVASPAQLPDQLLPGNTASFSVRWKTLPPVEILTAHVRVSGTEEIVHTPVSASRSEAFWVVPWYLLAAVVALLAAVLAWRRRRRRHGNEPQDGAPKRVPSGDDTSHSAGTPEPLGVAQ